MYHMEQDYEAVVGAYSNQVAQALAAKQQAEEERKQALVRAHREAEEERRQSEAKRLAALREKGQRCKSFVQLFGQLERNVAAILECLETSGINYDTVDVSDYNPNLDEEYDSTFVGIVPDTRAVEQLYTGPSERIDELLYHMGLVLMAQDELQARLEVVADVLDKIKEDDTRQSTHASK